MNNLKYLAFLPIILYIFPVCMCQSLLCEKQNSPSGIISYSISIYGRVTKCWIIEVPENSYLRLDLKEMNFNGLSCSNTYLSIHVLGTNENYTYCSQDSYRKPVTALSDVNIFFSRHSNNNYHTSFKLYYSTENLICAQMNHFRCSSSLCIHEHQVCDGVKDCENGSDEVGCERGITAVKGMNTSRDNAVIWLKGQRSASFGWGKNTHRAITALYLAKAAAFKGDNLEEELMAKQLELQTSVALLRNSTDSLSVSELSMFVNALTVTCHNPRQFYGYDLLQILAERASLLKTANPSAYLTLCNTNWTVSNKDVMRLLNILSRVSAYPFITDIQAVAIMAVTCMKNKTSNFTSIPHAVDIYEKTIRKFIDGQLSDGSFGNVYTTALVTQALISGGQENNKQWNVTATAQYIMKQLNSSVDFLSAYLTLPIFSGRSLLDIRTVNCSNTTRKQVEDNEISDITNKFGGKMRIQYSLYVGDQKDVIHTMFLRIPENSTAYDVMRIAQVADSKYKFLYRQISGQMYVYEIAGITNDPEAGKFWLLYIGDRFGNGTIVHYVESPDDIILEDDEHLIMWYQTADI